MKTRVLAFYPFHTVTPPPLIPLPPPPPPSRPHSRAPWRRFCTGPTTGWSALPTLRLFAPSRPPAGAGCRQNPSRFTTWLQRSATLNWTWASAPAASTSRCCNSSSVPATAAAVALRRGLRAPPGARRWQSWHSGEAGSPPPHPRLKTSPDPLHHPRPKTWPNPPHHPRPTRRVQITVFQSGVHVPARAFEQFRPLLPPGGIYRQFSVKAAPLQPGCRL